MPASATLVAGRRLDVPRRHEIVAEALDLVHVTTRSPLPVSCGTVTRMKLEPGEDDHVEVGGPASQGRPAATAPRLLLARAASPKQQARTGVIRRRPNPWGRRASVAIFAAVWRLLAIAKLQRVCLGAASRTPSALVAALASSLLRCSAEVDRHHGSRLVIESVGRTARRSDAECSPKVADVRRSHGGGVRRARRRGGTRLPIDLVDTARRAVTHVTPTPHKGPYCTGPSCPRAPGVVGARFKQAPSWAC